MSRTPTMLLLCTMAAVCLRGEQADTAPTKGDFQLTFVHTYRWVTFTLSKQSPESSDGKYRLKKVTWTGAVELIDVSIEEKPILTVKDRERDARAATTVIVESSFLKQSATIKQLRME